MLCQVSELGYGLLTLNPSRHAHRILLDQLVVY
nr:MAG TPA: hypothetical protein [Caudoviricetes sp.]